MRVDGNIGGAIDGTGGGDLAGLAEQVAAAERAGYDGVWTTEVSRDPFLPLLLAADRSRALTLGTAIAVAFARNPMTVAMVANDLQSFSSGRFILGLGSQIKAHIQRRFSMPWSEPAARMREFVLALRAIWASWQDGSRLDFRGEFYQHTLMTPMFSPPPNPWGPPPVLLAAVGPRMTTDLHQLSVRGQWAAMTGLIDDTVLHTFAVVGRPDRVGPEIHRRFGDIVDRYTLYTPYPLPEQARLRIVTSLRQASTTPGQPGPFTPGGVSRLRAREA